MSLRTRNLHPWVWPADGARIAILSRDSTSSGGTGRSGSYERTIRRAATPRLVSSMASLSRSSLRSAAPFCGILVGGIASVAKAGRRLLRHPRPGARGGEAARGRGPPHRQAQHRQPGPVRLRGTRRDPRRRHPQPAPRAGLLRLPGAAVRPHRDRAALPGARHRRRRRRRHLARQRGQRTDHPQPAGHARQRRRGADPGAGLPAVDRIHLAGRRQAGALPLRRVAPAGNPISTTCAASSPRAPRRSW